MEENKEELVQSATSPPEKTVLIKISFILFGIGSLLGWNAILTELAFFDHFIGKLSPFKTLTFLNVFPNLILQFVLLYKKNLFTIKNQLIYGLIASIVLLIIIPSSIIIFRKHEIFNIILSVILFLIMGLVNALCNSGFYSFTSYFPLEMIVALSTGQGFAGLILNIIQYIIIPSIKIEKEDKKYIVIGLIFFIISALILLGCLFCLLFSFKNEYFIYYLNINKNEKKGIMPVVNLKEEENISNENEEENPIEITNDNLNIDLDIPFMHLFKLLMDVDLLCTYIYVITISLYPVSFENMSLFDFSQDYYLNTVFTIYNIFDILGRYLVLKINPNKKLVYITILSRTILLFSIPYNYYLDQHHNSNTFTSIFLIINVILLAGTNGIGTTLCFGIAPTLVNDDLKGRAGASISFFLIVGITIGSLLAFIVKAILDSLK